MSCPRCDAPLDEAAVRCPACGAPLRLRDEPRPTPLDRPLDLDRRRTRTPVPASTPPPSAAELDEGDLGDLSFDAPADDGPWTMAAACVVTAGVGAPDEDPGEPKVAMDAGDAAGAPFEEYCDGPSRDDEEPSRDDDEPSRDDVGEPSGWTDLRAAPALTRSVHDPEVEFAAGDGADRPDGDGLESTDEDGLLPADDDALEPQVEATDHDRIRRGRLLSMVSLALASAAALVAVLSSR